MELSPVGEQDESEALFMEAEPEDEVETKTITSPVMGDELAEQALQHIEGFEDALNAGEQEEEELNLDVDPLAGDQSVLGPAEDTGEPEDPAMAAVMEELPEEEIEPLEQETEAGPASRETSLQEEPGIEPMETAEEPLEAVEQTITPLDESDLEELEDLNLEVHAEQAGKEVSLVELADEEEVR